MIVVTDIKYVECEEDEHRLRWMDQMPVIAYDSNNNPEEIKITEEVVKGRYFVNGRGEKVLLGVKKDIQYILGLPFDVYDAMRTEIYDLNQLNSQIRKRLLRYSNMTVWQKIKYLFIGKF